MRPTDSPSFGHGVRPLSLMGCVYVVTCVVSCGVGVSREPRNTARDGTAKETAHTSPLSDGGDLAPDADPGGTGTGGQAWGTGGAAAANIGGAAGGGSGGNAATGTGGAAGGGGGSVTPATDAHADADGGAADVAVDVVMIQPEAGIDAPPTPSLCSAGFHSCGGTCVANLGTDHCGATSCTPCPIPVGGKATCDGAACGISCNADRHACGTTCVTPDDPQACGPSCTRCPTDPNGNAQCIGGTCVLQCRTGFHACGARCADDMSPSSCGDSCEPCAAPAGGRAICVHGRCDSVCNTDQRLCHGTCIDNATACDGACATAHHRCGDVCRSNGSTDSCGTNCAPCATRAGGEATCDGSMCGFRCRTGFHACGIDCPANGRSVACVGTRVAGDPTGYTDAAGQDAFVFVGSDGHIVQVIRAAGGMATTDLSRASQASVMAEGDAWGYRRTDRQSAIVYRGNDNHIHEIGQQGSSWIDTDFVAMGAAPAHPTATVFAYLRSDLRNTLIYRSADNHLWEIASNFDAQVPPWVFGDLTALTTPAPEVAGNPMAYRRADGKDAVVYRAADGHLHELVSNFSHFPPPWLDTDLTAAAGLSSIGAASDPWGFVRADGQSAVVFRGTDGALHELARNSAGVWTDQILPAVSPAGTPRAFGRANGKNAIVYRSTDTAAESIHLLTLDGAWTDLSLDALDHPPSGPAGTPFGHVTVQGLDAVLYRNAAGELAEHRLDIGGAWSAVTY